MAGEGDRGAMDGLDRTVGAGGGNWGVPGLKKGPWTAAEDAALVDYVRENGEGNWNSVQRKTGLMRCGKSCRLRWVNHLRPNLKKGAFSPEEERIILELHARFGNRWARMASQLPGRTDNEIKNYLNIRMKKRQRSNLPTYPGSGVRKAGNIVHQGSDHMHQQLHPQHYMSSLFQSQQVNPNHQGRFGFYPSLQYPFYQPNFSVQSTDHAYNNHQPYIVYSDPNHQQFLFNNTSNGGNFSMANNTLSPVPPSRFLQNPNINFLTMKSPGMFDMTGLSAMVIGAEDSGNGSSSNYNELPSSQTHSPIVPTLTPSSSSMNSSDCFLEAQGSNPDDQYYDIEQPTGGRNSGLLDSLLQEAKSIGSKNKTVEDGKNSYANAYYNGTESADEDQNQRFIRGKGAIDETRVHNNQMYSMGEDLSSLLVNFSSATTKPNWYDGGNDVLIGQSSSITLEGSMTKLDVCNDENALRPPAANSSKLECTLAASCRKNMPEIH